METDSGPYPWKMLGSLAPEDALLEGFFNRILHGFTRIILHRAVLGLCKEL